MLRYWLRRLGVALRENWYWLIVPVLVTGLYVAYAYTRTSEYRVQAEVRADAAMFPNTAQQRQQSLERLLKAMTLPPSKDPRVAARLFNQVFHKPAAFEELGLSLGDKGLRPNWRQAPVVRGLARKISLIVTERGFRLQYVGADQQVGRKVIQVLVATMASRLNGMAVHVLGLKTPGVPAKSGPQAGRVRQASVFSVIPVQVTPGQNKLSSAEITVAVWIFFVFFLLTILVLGAAEIFNRSLSSEKELAKYLDVPVLGTIPKVGRG